MRSSSGDQSDRVAMVGPHVGAEEAALLQPAQCGRQHPGLPGRLGRRQVEVRLGPVVVAYDQDGKSSLRAVDPYLSHLGLTAR